MEIDDQMQKGIYCFLATLVSERGVNKETPQSNKCLIWRLIYI